MRRHLALPVALLFIALGVSSNAQNADVRVDEGAPLTVECALRVEQRAEWRLDDGARPLPADLRPAGEAAAGARLTARLHAAAARPLHAGVYTCSRDPGAARVRVLVRAAPAAPPALPGAAETEAPAAASAPAEPEAAGTLQFYDVGRYFSLNCTAKPSAGAGSYVWKKNGTAVEELWDLRDRYKLEEGGAVFSMATRTNEDDFGNYSCALGAGAPASVWDVRGRPHAKQPHDTNVVEKQTLKLTCKVVGKPYPVVQWTFSNDTSNGTDVLELFGDRVQLAASEQGVEGALLVLAEAQRGDAGQYNCTPAGGVTAATTLRVKDQYAALWPFLGICAEVFVLCAIILVYEKRRTKPELDDSDTDNHDQKKS